MSVPEVIAFLFKIINFSVLIGLVIYIFQRKVRGQIKTKIREKEVFWQNLQTNKQALIDQQHKLQMERAAQKDYGMELLKKIETWDAASKAHQQNLIEQMKHNAHKVYERSAKFYEKKQERQLIKKAVPIAFDQARETLIAQFAKEENIQKYMNNIFTFMKKST